MMLRKIKPIRTLTLVALFAAHSHGLWAEEVGCIDETDYRKTQDTYPDLFAKYGMQTVSQAVLKVVGATQKLKSQVEP